MADKATGKIIGAAIEVHKILGCDLLESVYDDALCHEFDLQKIDYERQFNVDILYKDHLIRRQKLDLLVNKEIVVEIKSLWRLPDVATAQILSYLSASKLKRGLIIDFGERRFVDGVKRISLCPLWQIN